MVISTCTHCKQNHLICDNQLKIDLGQVQMGKKVEDYLANRGEKVQKMTISEADLDRYYLVDKDGELTLVPKNGGQVIYDGLLFLCPT